MLGEYNKGFTDSGNNRGSNRIYLFVTYLKTEIHITRHKANESP